MEAESPPIVTEAEEQTATQTAHVDSGYPPILDAAQVSELLGMNIQMVRKYAREGRMPAYRLPGGRTMKFFRDEIFEFLKAHPIVQNDDS